MKPTLVLAAALAVWMTANAQSVPWAAEPADVFGIPLGQRLANDDVRDCGGVQADASAQKVQACAIEKPRFSEGDIAISGLPIDAFRSGTIGRDDGLVTGVALASDHARYSEVRTILMERYGKPTRASKSAVQSKAGANFNSETLVWSGSHVTLTLMERSGDVGRTSTVFVHNASAKKFGAAAKAKTAADAKKL